MDDSGSGEGAVGSSTPNDAVGTYALAAPVCTAMKNKMIPLGGREGGPSRDNASDWSLERWERCAFREIFTAGSV